MKVIELPIVHGDKDWEARLKKSGSRDFLEIEQDDLFIRAVIPLRDVLEDFEIYQFGWGSFVFFYKMKYPHGNCFHFAHVEVGTGLSNREIQVIESTVYHTDDLEAIVEYEYGVFAFYQKGHVATVYIKSLESFLRPFMYRALAVDENLLDIWLDKNGEEIIVKACGIVSFEFPLSEAEQFGRDRCNLVLALPLINGIHTQVNMQQLKEYAKEEKQRFERKSAWIKCGPACEIALRNIIHQGYFSEWKKKLLEDNNLVEIKPRLRAFGDLNYIGGNWTAISVIDNRAVLEHNDTNKLIILEFCEGSPRSLRWLEHTNEFIGFSVMNIQGNARPIFQRFKMPQHSKNGKTISGRYRSDGRILFCESPKVLSYSNDDFRDYNNCEASDDILILSGQRYSIERDAFLDACSTDEVLSDVIERFYVVEESWDGSLKNIDNAIQVDALLIEYDESHAVIALRTVDPASRYFFEKEVNCCFS